MKRFLSLALSLCVLLSITTGLDLSAYATTYSGTCGDNVTWSLDTESGELVISGNGQMTRFASDSVAPWYSYRSNIKTATIKSGVTSIGNYAFYYCTGLMSITISDSVTSIGSSAFYNCTGLTSVTIPDSVTSIGIYAFYRCTSLKRITIGNSVTSIGDYAFGCCESLTSITIPDSVTSIGDYAFIVCKSLTSISVDANNKYYSSNNGVLFNKAKSILIRYPVGNTRTKYKIPNSVASIDRSAFSYSTCLTSITIPNSVTSIGDSAFSGCKGLTSVTIPNSVTSIGDSAFLGCYGLTSVSISNKVKSIGSSAFFGCTSLKSITIPNSVTSIGISAFSGCKGLTSVTILNKVTSIGSSAFGDCEKLNSLSIPCSVSVRSNSFSGCTNISTVKITKGSTIMPDYTEDTYKYLPWYISRNTCTSIEIENGVDNIGKYAFKDMVMLRNIAIPESVESIGANAFNSCTRLSKIRILNDECLIWDDSIPKFTTIEGYSDSSAEHYAILSGNKFSSLGVKPCKKCNYKNVITKATLTKNGKIVPTCTVCGATKTATTIYSPKSFALSATNYTYDGKAKKPTVTVKDSKGKKLVDGTDYTVKYSNNTKVGKASVKVTFKGNYSGTKTLTFKINPKGTNIKSLKAARKGFTVKWKKQATQTTGYQVQIATNSAFTKGKKTYTISKNSKTSKKITKLKGKKKYYVRVRTYKTVNDTKYYSAWSKSKSVKTKK